MAKYLPHLGQIFGLAPLFLRFLIFVLLCGIIDDQDLLGYERAPSGFSS